MSEQRTPGPWKMRKILPGSKEGERELIGDVYGRKGGLIVRYGIFAPDGTRPQATNGKEDAAYIVRAVNAHEELVAALKAVLDTYPPSRTEKEAKTRGLVRDALAKAEGRE